MIERERERETRIICRRTSSFSSCLLCNTSSCRWKDQEEKFKMLRNWRVSLLPFHSQVHITRRSSPIMMLLLCFSVRKKKGSRNQEYRETRIISRRRRRLPQRKHPQSNKSAYIRETTRIHILFWSSSRRSRDSKDFFSMDDDDTKPRNLTVSHTFCSMCVYLWNNLKKSGEMCVRSRIVNSKWRNVFDENALIRFHWLHFLILHSSRESTRCNNRFTLSTCIPFSLGSSF